MAWVGGAAVVVDPAAARFVPHLMQKAASSGSWVPHLGQYKVLGPPAPSGAWRYLRVPRARPIQNPGAADSAVRLRGKAYYSNSSSAALTDPRVCRKESAGGDSTGHVILAPNGPVPSASLWIEIVR